MTHQLNIISSPSYATPSKSRKQWAEHIASDFPSPVKYSSLRAVEVRGLTYFEDSTPVHLRRTGLRPSFVPKEESL